MKKTLFLTVAAILVLIFAVSGPAMAKKRFFGIATGGVGGVYYPLGGACAQCLTNKIPDMVVTAQSGNASVANTNFVDLTRQADDLSYVSPSDYVLVNDYTFIHDKTECEFSGIFTSFVADLYTCTQAGVRLGLGESLWRHLAAQN